MFKSRSLQNGEGLGGLIYHVKTHKYENRFCNLFLNRIKFSLYTNKYSYRYLNRPIFTLSFSKIRANFIIPYFQGIIEAQRSGAEYQKRLLLYQTV